MELPISVQAMDQMFTCIYWSRDNIDKGQAGGTLQVHMYMHLALASKIQKEKKTLEKLGCHRYIPVSVVTYIALAISSHGNCLHHLNEC